MNMIEVGLGELADQFTFVFIVEFVIYKGPSSVMYIIQDLKDKLFDSLLYFGCFQC